MIEGGVNGQNKEISLWKKSMMLSLLVQGPGD